MLNDKTTGNLFACMSLYEYIKVEPKARIKKNPKNDV